jgi:hypothetical protein
MNVIKVSLAAWVCFGMAMTAYANAVHLTATQPTKITFRIAHQNENAQPVYEGVQQLNLIRAPQYLFA